MSLKYEFLPMKRCSMHFPASDFPRMGPVGVVLVQGVLKDML